MRKILFFLGSMKRGGAERVISILSKKYAQKGWDTNIALLLDNKIEYELDSSTKIFDLTNNKGSRIKNIPYWIRTIRRLVKEENPDIVISFAARINIMVLGSCLGMKKKIVVSERNDPYSDGRGKIVDCLTTMLYPLSYKIVFQTLKAQSYFNNTIVKKSVIIPNPIEIYSERDEVVNSKIVSVGRLEKQKNHQILIEAFRKVGDIHPEMELYVYGEGTLRSELENRIKILEIDNKVHLEGKVSDVHEKIKDAAFFVLSSNYEGLSNALLEAMMMGIPCISTRCAGSDEYINNGENGLLVPVNDLDSLVDAMEMFVVNPKLRNRCAIKAKQESYRYSSCNVLNKWDEIVEDKDE